MGTVGYPGVHPKDLPAELAGVEGKPLSSEPTINAAINGWKGINFTQERAKGRQGDESEIYGEDILLGYRWFDYFKTRTQFPFGYGLSYTTFAYGKPSIAGRTVSIEVSNTGKVAGQEVVQFYVGDDKASVIRPVKELKFFQKVALNPGEKKTVSYTIQDDDLKFFDEMQHKWTAEPGSFTIYVGASSADIKGKVKYNL
ncbi:MAG: fibronectin type III-like domain-contianing protein [Bacteroidales bacterium]|nr:fibronectin type III-like domain-contianing protein [Bacteroidales bacterium]